MANNIKPRTSVWSEPGTDKNFEHYRVSEHFSDLRKWVDEAYSDKKLSELLDDDFINQMQNNDFFARLWELELAEWLQLTDLELIPTNGTGPDFCIEIENGQKIWIEAVLPTPDDKLDKRWRDSIAPAGELAKVVSTPIQEITLRYSSSLYTKAVKIKEKYPKIINDKDYILIAISAFPPGALKPDMEFFMRATLPMGHQVVHFSTDGKPLDPTVPRSSHEAEPEYTKTNGSKVLKQFLYPGDNFPYIDGVLFSEASNLQQLLGTWSSGFSDSTNVPHIFPNYASSKKLPSLFTDNFYLHKFMDNSPFMSLETIEPLIKLM